MTINWHKKKTYWFSLIFSYVYVDICWPHHQRVNYSHPNLGFHILRSKNLQRQPSQDWWSCWTHQNQSWRAYVKSQGRCKERRIEISFTLQESYHSLLKIPYLLYSNWIPHLIRPEANRNEKSKIIKEVCLDIYKSSDNLKII